MSVFVCGSLHLDVIVQAPHLPRLDETVAGQGVAYAFGGKGGNQAVAAARMGARVAMAGRVGSDEFGRTLLAALAGAGVEAGQVQRDEGASGMSVAVVEPGGGYGAVIVSAANLRIDGDTVAVPPGTRIVMLQNEIPEAVNLTVARKARAAGARVILNAAPARPMSPQMLAEVDLLVVNRVEAADLSGDNLAPEAMAQALTDLGPRQVIVTLGAGGLVIADGAVSHLPGHAVCVVSTHGAGDAFLGALAARLDAGDALAEAARFGQAAAALHVSTPVADRADITPEAVRALMGQSR